MSFLQWLFPPPRLRIYEDTFARTRSSMFNGLHKAIEARRHEGVVVLIVSHFPETFAEMQSNLGAKKLDYEIVRKPIGPHWIEQSAPSSFDNVHLCLADHLIAENLGSNFEASDVRFCVMVVERHPYQPQDKSIEAFCRALPGRTELGYFLSFEDAVVERVINDAAIRILDMFGMGENELVTSNMISRRLKMSLANMSKSVTQPISTDSAGEWLLRNVPHDGAGARPTD